LPAVLVEPDAEPSKPIFVFVVCKLEFIPSRAFEAREKSGLPQYCVVFLTGFSWSLVIPHAVPSSS
jgi:hypothetical protein